MAVKSKARLYAYQALKAFEEGAPSIDPYLEKIYEYNLPRRDLALTIELILGVIRWLRKIDFTLSRFSKKPLSALDIPIKTALRLGVYQIIFLDRIPVSAATDESVELVKKDLRLSGASFVNGVLRKIARSGKGVSCPDRNLDEVLWLSVHYSHPEWMIKRWLRRFGKEKTGKILESNNEHPPLSLWINTKRFSIKRAMECFQKDNVQVVPSRYLANGFIVKQGYPHKTSLFQEGGCYIQDEAAQLVPSLLGQTLSGIAADICCAPGGKGLKMVHDAQDHLFVIGIDVSLSRLSMLKENLHRLQLSHFSPVMADAEERSPLKRKCDFILVDAPCSGTGVIRRNPEIKWRLKQENIRLFQDKQLAILNTVSHGVKRGGLLLYSVCSIEDEENEQVVRSFLSSNSHFHLENPSHQVSQKIHRFLDQEGFFRTYPYRDSMDGFFAALFRHKN